MISSAYYALLRSFRSRDRRCKIILAIVGTILVFICYWFLSSFPRVHRTPGTYSDLGGRYCVLCEGGEREPFIAKTSTNPPFYIRTASPKYDLFVSRDLHMVGTWDPLLIDVMTELIDALPPHCDNGSRLVIDAGANMGFYGLFAAMRGCRVASIEIQDRLISYIQTSLSLNDISQSQFALHHVALSDTKGDRVYFTPKASNLGGTSLERGVGTSSILTDTLDNLIPPGENVLLLKIDVEGFEEKVLAGATRLLSDRSVQHIAAEIRNTKSAVLGLLDRAGYEMLAFPGDGKRGPLTWMTRQEAEKALVERERIDFLFRLIKK